MLAFEFTDRWNEFLCVVVTEDHPHSRVVHPVRQLLFGAFTKWLGFLRCGDAGEAERRKGGKAERRILRVTCSASSTVMVSPLLTPTTRPYNSAASPGLRHSKATRHTNARAIVLGVCFVAVNVAVADGAKSRLPASVLNWPDRSKPESLRLTDRWPPQPHPATPSHPGTPVCTGHTGIAQKAASHRCHRGRSAFCTPSHRNGGSNCGAWLLTSEPHPPFLPMAGLVGQWWRC